MEGDALRQQGGSSESSALRTKNFHKVMEAAEDRFAEVLKIPRDTHEVHFFNGGATLQFAAIPLNLMAQHPEKENGTCNYIMNGHWSEKAANEARLFVKNVHECTHDPQNL